MVKVVMEQPVTDKDKEEPVEAGAEAAVVVVFMRPIATLVMEEMQDMLFVC